MISIFYPNNLQCDVKTISYTGSGWEIFAPSTEAGCVDSHESETRASSQNLRTATGTTK